MRLTYIDNLRVFLTIFLVVFHTAIAYGAAGSWIHQDAPGGPVTGTVVLLTIFVLVGQAFGLSLLFFVSTYLAPASLDRKGGARYRGDRLVRLGAPMLAHDLLIGPVTVWLADDRATESLSAFDAREVVSFRAAFFGPTWLLEVLIYFGLAYVALRWLAARVRWRMPAVCFPRDRTLFGLALLFGALALGVRLVYPVGTGPLDPQVGFFPLYILAMVAGVLAYRNGWLTELPATQVRRWTLVAIALVPVLPALLVWRGATHGVLTAAGGWHLQAAFYAFWEPFLCFGLGLGLLQRFRLRHDHAGPLARLLSRRASTVYVIHPPVVVGC
jgi:glucan biosynthesis protein C